MPWKENEAVPEGNDPIPQYATPGTTLLEDFRQTMVKVWDRKLDKLTEGLRRTDQGLASLEHGARQPRLAMKADRQADKKTCERTEGAAKAVATDAWGHLFCKKDPRRSEGLDHFRQESRTSRSPLRG